MTRLERNANIAAVVIPFLGIILAGVLLWNSFLGPRDLVILAVMYAADPRSVSRSAFTGCSPTGPFRRARGMRYTLAILGSMSPSRDR